MHPFFANRMPNKIAAEATPDYLKPEDKSFMLPQEKGLSCCPPIHVHDSPKVHFHFLLLFLGEQFP